VGEKSGKKVSAKAAFFSEVFLILFAPSHQFNFLSGPKRIFPAPLSGIEKAGMNLAINSRALYNFFPGGRYPDSHSPGNDDLKRIFP
jgi:hypothetical protein